MATEFAKVVRKIRIDKDMMLGEMAKGIDVSSAYLSSVENGRKKIPESLVGRIVDFLELNQEKSSELQKAADNSPVSLKLDLSNAMGDDRMLANAFARKAFDLPKDKKQAIYELLNSMDEGK